MDAKQKTKELINNFMREIQMSDKYNYLLDDEILLRAKQCALICVEEIIKENERRGQPTIDWVLVKEQLLNN